MIRPRREWLLWVVFTIALVLVTYNMITGSKPTAQLMAIQLLGLGCGLIAVVRRRMKRS